MMFRTPPTPAKSLLEIKKEKLEELKKIADLYQKLCNVTHQEIAKTMREIEQLELPQKSLRR